MTEADPNDFHQALRRCWSAQPSPLWLSENPACGQCNVTALVFHDRFGGQILKTRVEDEWHFYNRVVGTAYDLTAEQFAVPQAYLDILSNREEALAGTAPERYQAHAAQVRDVLGMR